jgi:hypothetical protein
MANIRRPPMAVVFLLVAASLSGCTGSGPEAQAPADFGPPLVRKS